MTHLKTPQRDRDDWDSFSGGGNELETWKTRAIIKLTDFADNPVHGFILEFGREHTITLTSKNGIIWPQIEQYPEIAVENIRIMEEVIQEVENALSHLKRGLSDQQTRIAMKTIEDH